MEDFSQASNSLSSSSNSLSQYPNISPYRSADAALLHQPIVWAIDAFPEDFEMQLKTAEAIQMMYPETAIHPVYVLREEVFLDRGYSTYLRPALKPMAFKAVLRILSETRLQHIKKPRILVDRGVSQQTPAQKILRYSRKIGAGAIAVGTHARGGLSRIFTSSFCEELMDANRLPVLIAGPQSISKPLEATFEHQQSHLHMRPRTIVFPTDFSRACEHAFEQILSMAELLDAEIHLFHKQTYTVDPYNAAGMGMLATGWVSVDSFATEIPEDHRSEVEVWMNRASDQGIAVRYISDNYREPTSEAIVQYVKSLDDSSVLLAMVSQTGPVASALLGSITREVIRMSPCPIYIAPRRH